MKYRIINIEYWKQFTQYSEPEIFMHIRGMMNDETHIFPENIAKHGLEWNCISVVPESDMAMEEGEKKEKPKETSKFVCDVCGKVCKNSIGLSGHKRSHK